MSRKAECMVPVVFCASLLNRTKLGPQRRCRNPLCCQLAFCVTPHVSAHRFVVLEGQQASVIMALLTCFEHCILGVLTRGRY